jgi:hypothetical protein
MPPTWRPMHTAPRSVARVWLNHMTLGPILVEGRPGRWYAPSAARQVWRWYRPAEPDALEPFSGWLPYEALAVKETGTAPMDDSLCSLPEFLHVAGPQFRAVPRGIERPNQMIFRHQRSEG